MKIFAGLREVIHNFTSPIEDTNAPTVEVSAEAFVAMAKKSGMTKEQIEECLKNMNGITIAKKSKKPVQEVSKEEQLNNEKTIQKNRTSKNIDKGREPGE